MASQIRASRSAWLPALLPLPFHAAADTRRAPAPLPIVAVSRRERARWAPLGDIAYAVPGTIIVGLDGTTLRIREDGGAEEVRT